MNIHGPTCSNLFFIFLIMSFNAGSFSIPCETRWRRISLKNYLIADYVHVVNVTSVEKCGESCLNVPDCKSFGISSEYIETMECILYNHRVWNKRILRYYQGLIFYWLLEDNCPINKGFTYWKTQNMCLKAIKSLQSWTRGLELCQKDGGHLAILDTLNKSFAINNSFQDPSDWFVGGVKFSTHFIWMNSVKINNWANSYPLTATNKCVAVSDLTFHMKNLHCDDLKPALCEIPMS